MCSPGSFLTNVFFPDCLFFVSVWGFVSLTWIRVLLDAGADRQKGSSSHNQLSVHARASVFSSSPVDAIIFPSLFVDVVLRCV